MDTIAVVLKQPEQVELNRLALTAPTPDDAVVDIDWSGISTGTERLLWSGRMPPFPGMGYPLVPGYESVGRVVEAGYSSGLSLANRYLFLVPVALAMSVACLAPRRRGWWWRRSGRCRSIGTRRTRHISGAGSDRLSRHHREGASAPDCIVGHGVLGRLLARIRSRFATIRRRCGKKTPRAPAARSVTACSIPSMTPAMITRTFTTLVAMQACSIR